MISKIWAFFIIVGILFSIITNNLSVLNAEILNSSRVTLNMILKVLHGFNQKTVIQKNRTEKTRKKPFLYGHWRELQF